VERSTRYLILVHLRDGVSSAEMVAEALGSALGSLPAGLRRTLTWDQGKELALHQQLTAQTGAGVFFCDPHSPWQRGSNENMNGLLRDSFPKGIDLTAFTATALAQVAVEVNQRPRKTLGWTRPADLFSSALVSCA
jgi:IS30 family transposase